MFRLWLAAALVALAFGQAPTLPGDKLHSPNPDFVRGLSLTLRARMLEAQAANQMTPRLNALASGATAGLTDQDLYAAYRYTIQFLLELQGDAASETLDVAASFDFKLERSLLEPGEALGLRLEPLFDPGHPLSSKYSARFSLKSPDGQTVGRAKTIEISEVQDLSTVMSTNGLGPGYYFAQYELLDGAGKQALSVSRLFTVIVGLDDRLLRLRARLLEARLVTGNPKPQQAAFETIEYITESLSRARKTYVGSLAATAHPITARVRRFEWGRYFAEPFNAQGDLQDAEALAQQLREGTNPWEGMRGDLHLAYRSGIDGSLQPYRLYIPKNYDPGKSYALIVALHGAGGDENSYFDRFGVDPAGEILFQRYADERGYIVACPNGRGIFAGYGGDGEQDVLDVIDRVKARYPVSRVFLTGHSFGGAGTLAIGFHHPDWFAALAPVSGAGVVSPELFAKGPTMPVRLFYGLADELVPAAQMRAVAAMASKGLKDFAAVELPNVDHFGAGRASTKLVFDFFDQVTAPRPESKPDRASDR